VIIQDLTRFVCDLFDSRPDPICFTICFRFVFAICFVRFVLLNLLQKNWHNDYPIRGECKMKFLYMITLLLVLPPFSINNRFAAAGEMISVVPSAADADESQEVYLYLTSLQKMPKPSYRKPLTRIAIITYYQVKDNKIQEEIASILREEIRRRSWKPVQILFMDEEILIKSGDVTRRGKEIELRRITVN